MEKKKFPTTWDKDLCALAQAKFYLVSRRGPLVFKLRSGDSESTYTVCIASPSHRCSCGGGEAKGLMCVHILFVVIKILKVPQTNPLAWALRWSEGVVDRILSGRLDGGKSQSTTNNHAFLKKGDRTRKARLKEDESAKDNRNLPTVDEASVAQRELEQSSTCSICQDEMTDSQLDGELLCYCSASCGSSFHKGCMRVFAAHARMERKTILCPLCRAPWTASCKPPPGKSSARRRLPPLQCNHCRLTVRKKFVRCASCPSLDLCQGCFDGGADSYHNPAHVLLTGDVSQNPTQWKAVHPSSHRNNRLREERERLSLLQYRDLSSADYHELLSLESSTLIAPPLHEHLLNALPEILTSDYPGQKCPYCSISLAVDRTARQFPCRPSQHIIHQTCAVSILLSALSASECEGSAVGSIVCPFCPVSDAKSALLFPSLQREPERDQPARKIDASNRKPMPPCDVTNLSNAFGRSLTVKGDNGVGKPFPLSITGVTQNSNTVANTSADNPVDKRVKYDKLTFQKRNVNQRIRRTQHGQSEVEMMLSGINYAERQQSQQPKQIKRTRKTQDRKSSRLVSTKSVSNNTSRIKDDGIDHVPSNLSGILQIGGNKVVKK
mmetsp:Transcript_16282/g.29528  ORF Transcript_16282/g.29528 Transcript_16282/m.29528 type:complete len:610 (-) Transcript_16282:867-2696(-)